MNRRKARAIRKACVRRWGQEYPKAFHRAVKSAYSAQPHNAKDVKAAIQSAS